MPHVHFYLKRPEPSGLSLIYLQFKYSGHRVIFSFNQQIKPSNWNKKKQRVKSNSQTAKTGDDYINDLLDNLEKVCMNAYKIQVRNGIPNPAIIEQALTDFIIGNDKEGDQSLLNLIDRFVAGEILFKGKKRSAGTLKTYNLTKNRLLEFSRAKKYAITFDSITVNFYYKFVKFLQDKKTPDGDRQISDSSIGNSIKDIKTFMSEAVELDYTTNIQFKKKRFHKLTEETDAVYLTWDEILKVYRHNLSFNKVLEPVRDLFVFGCCVGLRYSDYSRVKPENIIQHEGEYYISMSTQKTGEKVVIPCNPIVLEIFKKYKNRENRLPPTISNQKFNQYIKDACELAGLNEVGRLQTQPEKQLWECVSSHTARRSGLTNYYLEGVPTVDLMKISGHKTEKSFLNYIKVSKLETAKRVGEHIKKSWSEKLLKVAS